MHNTPLIFIVTECGGKIGFGHLTRCQALVQAFNEIGVHPTLLLEGDPGGTPFALCQSVQQISWHNDPTELWQTLDNADMVIVDSLLGSDQFFSKIQNEVERPVFLDDFKRRDYRRGIVVDWTVLAERIFYSDRHPDVSYLLGSRYTALRREFWEVETKPTKPEIGNILVTFGGSDVANMTPAVLRVLTGALPETRVNVVIGPGFYKVDEITKNMQSGQHAIHAPDAKQMKELMLQADLAIATGGQTLYELARMGVPTIAVMVVDNQSDDISGWDQAGFIQYAGLAKDADICEKIRLSLELLAPYPDRLDRSQAGQMHVDGHGAKRLVAALKEKL